MKKVYLFAAVMALLTAVLVYYYLRSVDDAEQPPYVQVVAAVADIPAYTRITADMLTVRQVPAGSQHPQSVYDAADALGRVSDSPILAGETLLSGKLREIGASTEALAYLVVDGMRAFTISVDSVSGVAGFLRRDDTVDILATIDLPQEQPEEDAASEDGAGLENTTIMVAENIRILAAGSSLAANADNSYTTVTLLATAEEAEKIVFAMSEGRLTLLLRSVTDTADSDPPRVTRDNLAE